ncbi:MAG: winged helix-turn-helix transcriptional regulator [Clostridia bacterium]|nr:winged helix-turn-helix transcriptional regulator [Clostridia bacterium]
MNNNSYLRGNAMNNACDEEELHEARIKAALAAMPAEEKIEEMGARFKALAEPSRLKILLALSVGELCVDHIVEAVGGNQSAVSHQLKALKDNRIVKCRRDGKKILYSVSDGHVLTMIEVAKEHLNCNE